MTIKRTINGAEEEIELTEDEIRMVGLAYENLNTRKNILHRINETRKPQPTEQQMTDILDGFYGTIGWASGYWDYYWQMCDDAIKDVMGL